MPNDDESNCVNAQTLLFSKSVILDESQTKSGLSQDEKNRRSKIKEIHHQQRVYVRNTCQGRRIRCRVLGVDEQRGKTK